MVSGRGDHPTLEASAVVPGREIELGRQIQRLGKIGTETGRNELDQKLSSDSQTWRMSELGCS